MKRRGGAENAKIIFFLLLCDLCAFAPLREVIRREIYSKEFFMKTGILTFALFFTAFSSAVYSQDFSRTIELKNPRMNGQDVLRLQNRLLALGFSGIGEADGKVKRALWDYIFDNRNSAFLRDVGIVSTRCCEWHRFWQRSII